MTDAVVANEGDKVVFIVNEKRVCEMPPEIARQVASLLLQKAAQADEYIHVNRIIMDQAILQRAGVPVGLSSNPKVLEAAKHEAQHNRSLRRYMPLSGIVPTSIVGTPTLRKEKLS